MYKVSFICNWGLNSKDLLNLYKRQTPSNLGIWKNVIGVDSIDECDFVIVLGKKTNFNTNKPIIQFRREPDVVENFVPYKNSHEVYDYSLNKFHVAVWTFISKTYDELINLPYQKTKKISVVASNKWNHRVEFLKKIEGNNNIDFFGRRYKSLNYKDDGILPYEYSVAIENSSIDNYFSEKINDCFLLWSKPIYWGCSNINHYFPEDSYEKIDLDDPKKIIEIINKPVTKKDIELLRESRNLVLNSYNMWEVIYKIVNNI